MSNLKERWGIKSNWQILIILFVFSITGSSSLFIAKPIIKFIGITKENLNIIVYWILYVIISFIFYQIMLVIFGWLFGQFKFFWNMEKKMLSRLGFKRLFS
ncbi:MAG: Na+-driven multidrug efflux pump [Flavobacteriales bacterium]|jgi:Na+-driven multidrug efflux pump|tara:strand:- start:80 stop:382 length:303 start_codon:yes stop_codon:yes gene_type:complete